MKREITRLEASRVSGGFDHLPTPPAMPQLPEPSPFLQSFLEEMEEQRLQELMELLALPGH